MSLFAELKRRSVARIAVGYLAGSWLLIQVLETLLPIFGLEETAARAVVVILAIGFIPALIIAWMFELTPEGLKRDDPTLKRTPEDLDRSRRADRAIVVVLIIAVGYFAIDKFVVDPARDAAEIANATDQARTEAIIDSYGERSIAVLPFADLSQAGDQQYLSDGFAEEVLNLLSRIDELRVISRMSAFSFRGEDIQIPVVAERLNVSYVLVGSVRTDGERIRVTAQLVEAASDSQVWSESFNEIRDDVFDVQEKIARNVVEALKLELLGSTGRGERTDADTHMLVLQANQIWTNRIATQYEHAENLLLRALDNDPEYLPAWVTLWRVNVFRMVADQKPWEVGIPLVRDAVARASEVNPNYAKVLMMQGWIAKNWDKDWRTGAQMAELAMRSDPRDADVIRLAGQISRELGRFELAIELGIYSLSLNPLCPNCYENLMESYLSAGYAEDALQAGNEMRALGFDSNFLKQDMGRAYLLLGDPQAALAEFQAIDDVYPGPSQRNQGAAMALHEIGRYEDSAKALELAVESGMQGYQTATIFAWIGDVDRAFEQLDRYGIVPGNFNVTDPFLVNLHSDPRWAEYVARYEEATAYFDTISLDIELPDSTKAGDE